MAVPEEILFAFKGNVSLLKGCQRSSRQSRPVQIVLAFCLGSQFNKPLYTLTGTLSVLPFQ
jgi:hypothetical protein